MSESKPRVTCRKNAMTSKLRNAILSQDKLKRKPVYCLSGVRQTRGMSLDLAFVWNVGALHEMIRENPISAEREGGKYRGLCRSHIIP